MKKLILAATVVLVLGFMVLTLSSFAGEINLENPATILPPATKIVDHSITFTPSNIQVKLFWYAADGSLVKNQDIIIEGDEGADFNALMGAKVQASHVGQKFSDIMFKAIRNKCKDILEITGTVN